MSKVCPCREHPLSTSYHTRTQSTQTISGKPGRQDVPEGSFSAAVTRNQEGGHQTANMEASQEAGLLLHRSCQRIVGERIRGVTRAADGGALLGCPEGEGVGVVLQACLSPSSCLALGGTACVCRLSNAKGRQLVCSGCNWALGAARPGRRAVLSPDADQGGQTWLCLPFSAMAGGCL